MVNTNTEKIAQIEAAIIDYTHSRPAAEVVDEIGLILAEPGPVVEGVALTLDEASACSWALDHLVAKHDYDALRGRDGSRVDLRALASRLLADGVPVEGVAFTLTSDEAVTVKFALDYTRNRAVLGGRDQAHMKALAARLEASA